MSTKKNRKQYTLCRRCYKPLAEPVPWDNDPLCAACEEDQRVYLIRLNQEREAADIMRRDGIEKTIVDLMVRLHLAEERLKELIGG